MIDLSRRIVSLTRRVTFCSSHRLDSPFLTKEENKQLYDKCNHENGHGHNYALFVTVRGPIDPKTGLIINLVDLKEIIDRNILKKVDHYHLNLDIPELKNVIPSVENLVVVFWEWLKPDLGDLLYEVKLYETENNIASYRG